MRILLVSPYFPPQTAIASRRVHAFALHWSRAGEEVTVLTTAKRADQCGLDLPQEGFELVQLPFRVPRALERLRSQHKNESHANVETPRRRGIKRVLSDFKERTGAFSSVRMPDLTDYWVKPAIAWASAQQRWDVVVSSSGPYTAGIVATALKASGAAKRFIADIRDLWTDNPVHHGLFPFTLRERVLERRWLRSADLLVTVSEEMAKALRAKSDRDVEVIYNGFDAAASGTLSPERMFPRDGLFRIIFTGTLYGRSQGFDPQPLLRAMRLLREQNAERSSQVRLVVAGSGQEEWNEMAAAHGVAEQVETRGFVSGADALRMQRDADALLLLDHADPNKGPISGKTFEYLNAAAPILVVGGRTESPMGRLVEQARRGVIVADDAERIAHLLSEMIQQQESDRWKGDQDFISGFSRERQSLRLLECIRRVSA